MNIQESDILKTIYKEPFVSQRILAESSGHSLGVVNRSLKYLTGHGYISNDMRLTSKGIEEIEKNRPANAIILAAGVGMRMVPINAMTPKGLLAVKGEPLVERLIRQLHEVNVTDITIVVGFMKERFDHLIDKYGVKLVVNTDYADKNNLHSLALAAGGISNTYIVPCDVWAAHNPFSLTEMYSWYMVSDAADIRSDVRVNRKMELVSIPENSSGNAMIGIAYILAGDAQEIRDKIKEMASGAGHDDDFWEAALYSGGKMSLAAKVVPASDVSEIDTYEQLRKLDGDSDHLRSDALDTIAGVLSCTTKEIRDITVLKKGMTNRSFLFTLRDRKYIMRIPGEGTDRLINRRQEAEVYKAIKGYGFCDDPVYIDPVNGYKITEYLEGVRVCDAASEEDLCRCMEKLKEMHSRKLQVGHEFDIFGQILFYEKLWNGIPSAYGDYDKTKQNVFSLKGYIEEQPKDRCLTHIDAVPDNFLFYQTEGGEKLQLTDWEYSGMQDPHVDLAMFSIYSYFDKKQIDRLMDIYFGCEPPHMIRAKIYCYVAACGLLWSNWTEYKSTLGVEFGEYGLKQYRYAKDFYAYAREEMELDRRSKE